MLPNEYLKTADSGEIACRQTGGHPPKLGRNSANFWFNEIGGLIAYRRSYPYWEMTVDQIKQLLAKVDIKHYDWDLK